ncbi:MAG: TRAP transporter large permease subunit [Pseudomonadota bacterium]|nr:TRAP transporter large permease subunit [Pseudomonadota bacterium]MEC8053522.1 TRAP transporter large permease subunit [Pseudomonadota bacterium]MEC8061075.1 TRAP transporter large permease subunit [Pseudomonadota bacterium]MEC8280829.1 TRAP transporter large permease subunit [Pseudomonadota bacterium]MEC8317262.1 TRAP transporter large permease subunit [Pseudomonadota bacterium]
MTNMTERLVGAPIGEPFNRSVDHVSRFLGLSVGNLYLLAAACTLWEVFSRYLLNQPTQWVFEVVMVLCAVAWMISAGFVTLQKRHIGITVLYLMAPERVRWWLDLFAMVVGVFALYMMVSDTLIRALESIDLIERGGTAWNSPLPMIVKTVLVTGLFVYLVQLLVNLGRHFQSSFLQVLTLAVLALICLRLLVQMFSHYGEFGSLWVGIDEGIAEFTGGIIDQFRVDRDSVGIAMISTVIVIALLLLMMTGMPLGIVTLIISVGCALAFYGIQGMYLVSTNAVDLLEKYPLVAVPFFVLMASILERAGIAQDLFDAMSIFAGGLRGGVALQTTVVAVILAAMSGVMGGEIVMLGLVALPQMLRLGYDRKLTIGLICAAGALATLIPPSIVMIVYGLSANVGIGDLFTAGFIPGLMLATFYVSFVLIRCNLNPSLAPTAAEIAEKTGVEAKLGRHQIAAVAMCIALIFCVMGSIYGGITSVTEAAAVGVFGAIAVAAVRFKFNYQLLRDCLANTMAVVGTIIWLILGAVAFVGLYNLIGGADFMRGLIKGTGLSALGTIFVMMAILVILGTFMEWIAIIFITVPVFAPVVRDLAPELGMTPEWAAVWFGILFVMNIQIYFLSPPFGPACFWLKSVAPKDVTLQEIFVSVLPFIALQITGMLLVMFIPQIALWMPQALN